MSDQRGRPLKRAGHIKSIDEQSYAEQRERLLPEIGASLRRIREGIDVNKRLESNRSLLIEALVLLEETNARLLPTSRDPNWMASTDYIGLLDMWATEVELLILTADADTVASHFADILKLVSDEISINMRHLAPDDRLQRGLSYDATKVRLLRDTLTLSLQQKKVQSVGEHVNSVAEHVEQVAGRTASGGLAQHYEQSEQLEFKRQAIWTVVLICCVLGSLGVALWALSYIKNGAVTAHELWRLSLALSFVFPATYAARQATYHRNAESEARSVAVQLMTVHAFTDALEKPAKQEIIRVLGLRIFGSCRSGQANSSNEIGIPADLGELVKHAVTRLDDKRN